MIRGTADLLMREFEKKRFEVEVLAFEGEREPFRYI